MKPREFARNRGKNNDVFSSDQGGVVGAKPGLCHPGDISNLLSSFATTFANLLR